MSDKPTPIEDLGGRINKVLGVAVTSALLAAGAIVFPWLCRPVLPQERVIVVTDEGFVNAGKDLGFAANPRDVVRYELNFGSKYVGICVGGDGLGLTEPMRFLRDVHGSEIQVTVPSDAKKGSPWWHLRILADKADMSCDALYALPTGDEGGGKVGGGG